MPADIGAAATRQSGLTAASAVDGGEHRFEDLGGVDAATDRRIADRHHKRGLAVMGGREQDDRFGVTPMHLVGQRQELALSSTSGLRHHERHVTERHEAGEQASSLPWPPPRSAVLSLTCGLVELSLELRDRGGQTFGLDPSSAARPFQSASTRR